MLHIIDDDWKENLRQLDDLRHSVQNASYEQRPASGVQTRERTHLGRYDRRYVRPHRQHTHARTDSGDAAAGAGGGSRGRSQRYNEQKVDLDDEAERAQQQAASQDTRETADQVNHVPYRAEKMPRPNDPCPCGSGKKFKNCHGRNIR